MGVVVGFQRSADDLPVWNDNGDYRVYTFSGLLLEKSVIVIIIMI